MGFKLSSKAEEYFSEDFEEALIEIMYLAEKDSRILSLLITWGLTNSKHVIVKKLQKYYKQFKKYRGDTVVFNIFAIYCLSNGDHRFKKVAEKYKENTTFPNRKSTESSVKLKGASPELQEFNILTPMNYIRIRKTDVSPTKDLIKSNLQFRNRFLFGPNWRADIIYKIQQGAKSPSDVSRSLGCSYEPVNRIWKEYHLAQFS
jgi:hypothetical protein